MDTIFLITNKNMLFSHPTSKPDGTHRTCLVAARTRMAAQGIVSSIRHSKHSNEMSIFRNDDVDDIKVAAINVRDEGFYKMLHLNNFALMLADTIRIKEDFFEINGDIIDYEYDIDNEHSRYMDYIYKKLS